MFAKITASLMLCLVGASLNLAHAHITLEQKTAPAGSTYKATFRVGHGCAGSPTTAISVFLPEGFIGAKPTPKAGWRTTVVTEKLATPYLSHGKPIDERAAQIRWSGGRLQDHEYDEFVLNVTLPVTPGKQWIRVLQSCEKGENDWAAIPQEGQARPAMPAPLLELLPSGMAAPTPAASAPAAHQH